MNDLESVGARNIWHERDRQIQEGFTTAHDDQLTNDELLLAAAGYLFADGTKNEVPLFWPASWENKKRWKPGDIRRNLVKAGALIAAEIDRLDRLADKDVRARREAEEAR